jgi:mono/diheme cytochrome c family protein
MAALAALSLVPAGVVAQEVDVEFTEEFLNDPAMIDQGEVIWKEQCRLCHGQGTGYPGKAPKLQPRRYSPEFVYHRVTHGFRAMPAWKDIFDEEQRMAVTAYILSNDFAD